MLEQRPNYELYDRDLPRDAADARSCSYYAQCVEEFLHDIGQAARRRPKRPLSLTVGF